MVQCFLFAANGVLGAGMMHRGGMMAEQPAAQNSYYTEAPKYSYTTAAPYYTPTYTTQSYYSEAPKYYSPPSYYTTKAPEYYTTACKLYPNIAFLAPACHWGRPS